MLRTDADEKGFKRLCGEITGKNNRNKGERELMGKWKIAYQIEVERRIHTAQPQTSTEGLVAGNNPMGLGLGAASVASMSQMWDSASYVSHDQVMAKARERERQRLFGGGGGERERDLAPSMANHPYRDEAVVLPCSLTLHTVIAMELSAVSKFKRNQPVLKVFCDNFYQLSQVMSYVCVIRYVC
jgi:hypothetical protein